MGDDGIVMGRVAPSDGGGHGCDWQWTLHLASEGEGDLAGESVADGWSVVEGPGALEAARIPGHHVECPHQFPA